MANKSRLVNLVVETKPGHWVPIAFNLPEDKDKLDIACAQADDSGCKYRIERAK